MPTGATVTCNEVCKSRAYSPTQYTRLRSGWHSNFTFMESAVDDPFDREPTPEELSSITPEDLLLDKMIRKAVEEYRRKHKKELEKEAKLVRDLQGKH